MLRRLPFRDQFDPINKSGGPCFDQHQTPGMLWACHHPLSNHEFHGTLLDILLLFC
jgi:hypothetical protein